MNQPQWSYFVLHFFPKLHKSIHILQNAWITCIEWKYLDRMKCLWLNIMFWFFDSGNGCKNNTENMKLKIEELKDRTSEQLEKMREKGIPVKLWHWYRNQTIEFEKKNQLFMTLTLNTINMPKICAL